MGAKIVNLNGKVIYFFISFESAYEASKLYQNFTVYEYSNLSLYIIAECNAKEINRPHLTDWNGTFLIYNRSDSDYTIEWRKNFIKNLEEVNKKEP